MKYYDNIKLTQYMIPFSCFQNIWITIWVVPRYFSVADKMYFLSFSINLSMHLLQKDICITKLREFSRVIKILKNNNNRKISFFSSAAAKQILVDSQ